ncbi:MAG: hypothetical protein JO001_14420 [Alphaproteobacteria bacterium]|nr:hypothetical protein [Alphaproteobacteria bacterium]
MNLRDAVAIAKHHVSDTFAADAPSDLRLEGYLYDDHLMVWSLTIGFAAVSMGGARTAKLVRVSEANQTVLSVTDQP